MEVLVSFLRSVLGLNTRNGAILFLSGVTCLLMISLEWLPKDELAPGWTAFFALLAIVGGSTLVVDFAHRGYSLLQESRKAATKNQDRVAAARNAGQKAIDNLPTLSHEELVTLLWLLRNDKFRFGEWSGYIVSLSHKLIVIRDGPVHQIHPAIWDRREEILNRHKTERTPSLFPYSRP